MPLTPATLVGHELNGLSVRVVDAANPDLVGIAGRVVRETTRTLVVRGGRGADTGAGDGNPAATAATAATAAAGAGRTRERQVPKRGTTFAFAVPRPAGESPAGGSRTRATGGRTDEAAGRPDGAPGTASERAADTAGRAGQSPAGEGAAHVTVTVDGGRLVARPARRRNQTGDDRWR